MRQENRPHALPMLENSLKLASIEIEHICIGGNGMDLTVYLAGEIHTNWRDEISIRAEEKKLQLTFVGPQTNHERSDNVGEDILGKQPGNVYKDDAASDINNFRTQVLMQKADIVIALFGEKYKQWNTAMDASTAIAMNKPTIIIRPESLIHPLKELSNKANVTVETVEQALDVISYIFE
jgi:YtoQ family protein